MTSDDLPPGVERCSCDEAVALRAEVARLQALVETWEQRLLEDFSAACKRLALGLQRPPAGQADPLHPSGRCTCGGEGRCDWCMTHCLHCGSGFPGGVPIRSAAEQRLLDAMARADTEELVALVDGELPNTPLWEIAACRAELARREAQR